VNSYKKSENTSNVKVAKIMGTEYKKSLTHQKVKMIKIPKNQINSDALN